jgi:hypothetical protein
MHKLHHSSRKLKNRSFKNGPFSKVQLIIFAMVFAIVGVYFIYKSFGIVTDVEGFTTITCEHSHFAQVDPIIKSTTKLPPDPEARSAHLHDFVGNTSTNSNSTTESLLAGGTTCKVQSDINAIWFPAMIGKDGNPIPGKTVYRLINDSPVVHGTVTIPPNGLNFIAGAPNKTVADGANEIWRCFPGGTEQRTIPASCPAESVGIRASFYNLQGCWNGTDMGPGLGRGGGPADAVSHMILNLNCPAPGVKIPRVSTILEWPASAAGGHLSSDDRDFDGKADGDPGASLHVDFVYISGKDSEGNDFYKRVDDMCLNQPVALKARCVVDAQGRLIRLADKAIVLEAGRSSEPPPATKTGDVNADNKVDITDLSILLTNFGKTKVQSSNPACDINNDGIVNIIDMSILMTHFGT